MPVFGLNNGMVPIIAYNYGARRPSRILQTVRFGACWLRSLCSSAQSFSRRARHFSWHFLMPQSDMLALGIPALRIISINFLFAGLGISFGSVFQAMGNGMYSLIVSACRQLLVLLPVAYLLAVTMGVHFVWWAFPHQSWHPSFSAWCCSCGFTERKSNRCTKKRKSDERRLFMLPQDPSFF